MKIIRTPNRRFFFIILILSSFFFIRYTLGVAKALKKEEQRRIALFAKAQTLLSNNETVDSAKSRRFLLGILENNTTIPVVLVNENKQPILWRNFPNRIFVDPKLAQVKILQLGYKYPPIVINQNGKKQFIYYDDSHLLKTLRLYPFLLVLIIISFLLFLMWSYRTEKSVENSNLWAGMAKETAHQIGTPLSSLAAWIEFLKLENEDQMAVVEMEKDVNRLNLIAHRFSKIGSVPELTIYDLRDVCYRTVGYLASRVSDEVNISFDFPEKEVLIYLNENLFSWVLENLIKNGVDAMQNKGQITVSIVENGNKVSLKVKDTGKGIQKKNHKKVFHTGFTTKKRGWGLGLSMSKRIIEEYHKAKIFIEESQIGKGTTFTIQFKRKTLLQRFSNFFGQLFKFFRR